MKEVRLTDLQLEILKYVKDNGSKNVEVAASTLNQNKNFYGRVRSLEHQGFITAIRFDGYASLLTLTDMGREIMKCCDQPIKTETPKGQPGKIETKNSNDLLKSIIRSSNIGSDIKNKIYSILD